MKELFDLTSTRCSKLTTRLYSTSFSMGIYLLNRNLHDPIYSIYGFVRLADEIVDSFHEFDKAGLLSELRAETYDSIERGISLNPILNSFQHTVRRYNIERELIDTFLDSMEMDLQDQVYDPESFQKYILGSAEVVGLMCLRVFTDGDNAQYQQLKPPAMALGSAFQKVNFLRDVQADYLGLGRMYFPGVQFEAFDEGQKRRIEADIEKDFREALVGIRRLPRQARLGVYAAYLYYRALFKKIQMLPANNILQRRIRISNARKIYLTGESYLKMKLNML